MVSSSLPSPRSGRTTPVRRVALLIESDGPGGAESVVIALATGLAARGIEPLPVILANGEGWLSGKLRAAGYPVFTPTLSRPLDPSFAWQLAQWARREQIDMLHAHEFTMGFYAGVAGALSGRPHLITMHGGKTFADATRRRRALAWSAKRAVATVGVSESTCDHLVSTLGIPRTRIDLVTNGVATLVGDRERTRATLGLTPDHRLLLAVGNLYAVKGHRFLVDAAQRLAQRTDLPPWRIAIAGRGDEEQALRAQITAAGLSDRVQLLGLRSDIADLLSAADGWVMSSLSEGLPMAMLEAMLAERPIISTAVGGIPDLIRDGDTGWLVPPSDAEALANAMASLLRDPDGARAIAARGKKLADRSYGLDAMVDQYLALYTR